MSPLSGDLDPASLAVTVPETEPEVTEHDPIEDSQRYPQTRLHSPPPTDEQREIPESLEIVVETSQAAPQEPEELVHALAEGESGILLNQDPSPAQEQSNGTAEQNTPVSTAPGPDLPVDNERISDPATAFVPIAEVAFAENLEDSQEQSQERLLVASSIPVENNSQLQPIDRSSSNTDANTDESAEHNIPQVEAAEHPGQSAHVHAAQPLNRVPSVALGARPQPELPIAEDIDKQAPVQLEGAPGTALVTEAQSSVALPQADQSTLERQALEPVPRHHSTTPSQHAQRIAHETYLSTQDDISESIRATVEKDPSSIQDHASPQSRHDSSQESPCSSPLPVPPSQSLGTIGSNAPTRPHTPQISPSKPPRSSLSSKMDTAEELRTELDKEIEKVNRENPFQSKRVLTPSKLFPSIGTRSPSAVPNRSPVPQVPTSLRTVAVTSSAIEPAVAPEADPSASAAQQEEGESGTSDSNNAPISGEPTMPVSTDEELSDADDASVLNDDLHLLPEEYIVPLPIEGRQASAYGDLLSFNKEMLKEFLNFPKSFDPIEKVEAVIQRLQAIETHIDLSYGASQSQDLGSSTQILHQTQWTLDNSIKFRFICALLHRLQEHTIHILLILERDDARLFDIVETCMKGRFVNFNSPTRGHQADPGEIVGKVSVTIVPRNSTPIVRPPDLIICLDGHADAGEIRKKNWAANPDRGLVPLLHLVIPRTVDHIVRYTSPTLSKRTRLHTIVATLAQLRHHGDIGRAMSQTPKTSQAAEEIAQFLLAPDDPASPREWPLPSIGSIKDVIEFQTQRSQEHIASPPRGLPTAKRPLEDDAADPSKRMRFTPQPHDPSSANNDTTHISDSLPGTAPPTAKLQQQLAVAKAEIKRLREREASWSKQQTAHEERSTLYARLQSDHAALKRDLDAASAREATLRERLAARTSDLHDLQARHKALQDDALLAPDSHLAHLTRLRADLAAAQASEQRAIAAKASAEQSLAYVSEQYRDAQTAAAMARAEVDALTATVAVLKPKADGEAARLQQLHYERREKLDESREAAAAAENRVLRQMTAKLEEEVARLKSARGVGVGTRAQTPRPGSRAASPMAGGRDRLANLRNG